MPFYRVIFANNNIISCQEERNIVPHNQDLYYEHDKGKLIFAYIKAENLVAAAAIATELIEKVKNENQ